MQSETEVGSTKRLPALPLSMAVMKRWCGRAAVVLGVLVVGYGVHVWRWMPLPLAGEAPDDGFTRVSGVVHVHTTYSDGAGTPEEVVAAARAAGLDFLVITDHNTREAEPVEGVHGGTLVLVGVEASTVSGHLLGLGVSDSGYVFSRDPLDTLEDVRDLGGVSFVAHPTSPRTDLRWETWNEPGPWGMEVINSDSEFRQASWAARLRTAATYALNPRYALLSHMTRPDADLQRWDALLAERPTPGIVGADVHGQIELLKGMAIKAPSYASMFSVARNHVLLEGGLSGSLDQDGSRLLKALAAGRNYVGLDGIADANGFFFVAEVPGKRWTMGDTADASPPPRLRAGGRMPAHTQLVLLRDGRPVAEGSGAIDISAPGPGVYRIEAYVSGWSVPWILSNAIAVMDRPTAISRSRRAQWAPPPSPPPPTQILTDFTEDTSFFKPEADSRSIVDMPLWDARGGVRGGAARFSFHLGLPDENHPHIWCALVNPVSRDLSGHKGLVFAVRGDGVYRFWVQVRDANPASPDGGTEWWFASVRTSLEWQRVAVPFARLRSIQKGSDGRLDLDNVRALVLIIDRAAMKPGSRGTIWIDDFGLY